MAHHLRMQPSEIDSMFYYEYWYYVRNLIDFLKEQDSTQKKEQEKADEQQAAMQSQMKAPKLPNYGNFGSGFKTPSLPSVKMPKL